MNYHELNLDGLVGPTHNYAGLGIGNIASINNALKVSNPKAAALQGLQKMRFLHDLGLKQAILPPHCRPNLKFLHKLGFKGQPAEQLRKAQEANPKLLAAAFSASSMWSANTATVTTSKDSKDSKIHFTTANLISSLHRYSEANFSQKLLKFIFNNDNFFTHHSILPRTPVFSDEGAANHNRLCHQHKDKGINLFVYGNSLLTNSNYTKMRFLPRQTLEASCAIARKHLLQDEKTIFIAQNPEAINQGVFHNDVISVANESLFLLHEKAFNNQELILKNLKKIVDFDLKIIEIKEEEISLTKAVETYLFNSQLLTLPNNEMLILAPIECKESNQIKHIIDSWIADDKNPITTAYYFNLKQSMQNGGGPACLRLRIVMSEEELNAMHQSVVLNDLLLGTLETWINKHYRDKLEPNDLLDPLLIQESFQALDELSKILALGDIYQF